MRLSGFGSAVADREPPALELSGLTQAEIDARSRPGCGAERASIWWTRSSCASWSRRDPDAGLMSGVRAVGKRAVARDRDAAQEAGVLYFTPRTLAEIDENILAVGRAIGREREALAFVEWNRARLEDGPSGNPAGRGDEWSSSSGRIRCTAPDIGCRR